MSATLSLTRLLWAVRLSPSADAMLDELQPKQAEQILTRIGSLATFQNPTTAPGVRNLLNDPNGTYRARQGHYRVLFRLHGRVLHIIDISHRSQCYGDH